MKTVAIVPIKLNNERLPGKNTKMLGDKPLIHYILDTLQKVVEIDETYVYCSSAEIERYLPQGIRFLRRDPSLDLPSSTFVDIQHAFSNTVFADVYVLAHATAPFLTSATITDCILSVLSGEHDSSFTAEVLQEFLWMEGKPINFDPENIPRTQDLIKIYKETTGLYVYTHDVLHKLCRRIGNNPFIVEIAGKQTVDIDYIEDFELAEYYLSKGES